MRLFLDTADITAIQRLAETTLIDGITTNPTHLSKEKQDPVAIIREICALLPEGDISVEVTESEPNRLYEQAKRIARLAENVVVKVPCVPEYYQIIAQLVNEQVPLNITLVFSVSQALMMSKLGVDYISPFVGRLDDAGSDGIQVVANIREMLDEYDFETQLLAASLRSVEHFEQVVLIGADCATVPVDLFEQLLEHSLTRQGIEQFDADWRKRGITHFP